MAKFVTTLDIDLLSGKSDDSVWRVRSPLVYISDLIGKVEIPVDFQTDLASVPRIPFIYALWGGRVHREGVLHDYLFRQDSKPVVPFFLANKVMLEAMKSRNKPFYYRWPIYLGVCAGGYQSYHKRKVADVLV